MVGKSVKITTAITIPRIPWSIDSKIPCNLIDLGVSQIYFDLFPRSGQNLFILVVESIYFGSQYLFGSNLESISIYFIGFLYIYLKRGILGSILHGMIVGLMCE
jgi:hypothetical protein